MKFLLMFLLLIAPFLSSLAKDDDALYLACETNYESKSLDNFLFPRTLYLKVSKDLEILEDLNWKASSLWGETLKEEDKNSLTIGVRLKAKGSQQETFLHYGVAFDSKTGWLSRSYKINAKDGRSPSFRPYTMDDIKSLYTQWNTEWDGVWSLSLNIKEMKKIIQEEKWGTEIPAQGKGVMVDREFINAYKSVLAWARDKGSYKDYHRVYGPQRFMDPMVCFISPIL